jgi:hypothetical protein
VVVWKHTGEVTSWTKCLSKSRYKSATVCDDKAQLGSGPKRTNVQQDCAIELLVNNVVRKDLVIQGLWIPLSARHCDGLDETNKRLEKWER